MMWREKAQTDPMGQIANLPHGSAQRVWERNRQGYPEWSTVVCPLRKASRTR